MKSGYVFGGLPVIVLVLTFIYIITPAFDNVYRLVNFPGFNNKMDYYPIIAFNRITKWNLVIDHSKQYWVRWSC
jgi:hypothetical protein